MKNGRKSNVEYCFTKASVVSASKIGLGSAIHVFYCRSWPLHSTSIMCVTFGRVGSLRRVGLKPQVAREVTTAAWLCMEKKRRNSGLGRSADIVAKIPRLSTRRGMHLSLIKVRQASLWVMLKGIKGHPRHCRQLRHPQTPKVRARGCPAIRAGACISRQPQPPGSMRWKGSSPSSRAGGSSVAFFRSVDEPKHRFIADTNGNPKPFVWTADRRSPSRTRCCQTRATSARVVH
jgi:hypothetical protein